MPKKKVSAPTQSTPSVVMYPLWAIIVVFIFALVSGLFIGKLWYKKQVATYMEEQAQLLYVQDAGAGTLTPVEDRAATYVLEFTDVTPRTLEFADQPQSTMGSMNIQEFEDTIWHAEESGFATEMPTGILMTHNPETGHEEAVVVKLSDFSYDEATDSLQYTVVVIPDSFVEGFSASNDTDFSDFPTQLTRPVLFIDSTQNWLKDWVSKRES